jgi:crotonobetainyl-CoA:carnitine CoA-transferase CaiB-like acyl-CoA transferase
MHHPTPAPPGALAGVRVLDLSRVLAGPYCTQLFADLGASVWKLEALTGDDTRRWGPPFVGDESAYFLSVNRGKKGLAVDLKHPEGREVARRLALKADVLVENFKVGDLARYGLDYKSLADAHPGLIYASVTGFGYTGPRRSEPGYDAAMQAFGGLMSLTGTPEGPPVKVAVAVIDVLTGLHLAVGILAALFERTRSGRGQHLDVALFDVAVASLINQAQGFLLTGTPPRRLGSEHPQIVPYGAFRAADGFLVLAVGNDAQFVRACLALGLPDLAHDPRFATNAGRVAAREEVVGRLAERFKERPRAVWLERLRAANVPATPVQDLAEVFAEAQLAARGMRGTVEHSALGTLEVVGSPLAHASRTPARLGAAPPRLGEHTAEVLQEVLGLSAEEVSRLEAAKALYALREEQ